MKKQVIYILIVLKQYLVTSGFCKTSIFHDKYKNIFFDHPLVKYEYIFSEIIASLQPTFCSYSLTSTIDFLDELFMKSLQNGSSNETNLGVHGWLVKIMA